MDCYSCRSLTGESRISPGPTILEGEHWVVEHAYPCSLKGWLVLVLKRHAAALHELSPEEFRELGHLQEQVVRTLRAVVGCEKEYVACFSEAEHFKHVHFHIVPKPPGLPQEKAGLGAFSFLNPSAQDTVPPGEVVSFCLQMQEQLRRI